MFKVTITEETATSLRTEEIVAHGTSHLEMIRQTAHTSARVGSTVQLRVTRPTTIETTNVL